MHSIHQGVDDEPSHKADILGKVKMDVTEFTGDSEKPIKLPIKCCIGGITHEAKLKVTLDFHKCGYMIYSPVDLK